MMHIRANGQYWVSRQTGEKLYPGNISYPGKKFYTGRLNNLSKLGQTHPRQHGIRESMHREGLVSVTMQFVTQCAALQSSMHGHALHVYRTISLYTYIYIYTHRHIHNSFCTPAQKNLISMLLEDLCIIFALDV